MSIIEIQESETGIDVGFNYPSAASILAKGYTFIVVYDSPNVKKNAPDLKVQEYIDAGLGVWHVYEVNAARTLLGRQAGIIDAKAFNQTLTRRNVPLQVPGIFANDTDTTTGNVSSQSAYMHGADDTFLWKMGGYQDIDLTRVTNTIPWSLLWLPNAWAWDHPNPKLKSEAIKQARRLDYHMIQGRLSDDVNEPSYDVIDGINVDINHCIRPCTAWGNPRPQPKVDTDMQGLVTNTIQSTVWIIRNPDGFLRQISPQEYRSYHQVAEVWTDAELAEAVIWTNPGPTPAPLTLPLKVQIQASGLITE